MQRVDRVRLIERAIAGSLLGRGTILMPSLDRALLQRMADLSDLIVHRRQIVLDFVQLVKQAGNLLLAVLHHGHGVVDRPSPALR